MTNEKRLIDADTLLETIHDTADGLADCDQQNAAWALRKYAVRDIMEAHTVDAVEVVRCKDCKYQTVMWCWREGENRNPCRVGSNDFCSYGEIRGVT